MRRSCLAIPLAVLLLLSTLAACTAPPDTNAQDGATPTPAVLPLLQEPKVPTEVELYSFGLNFPTRMVWAPDGRLFVAEKGGGIRVISADGVLQPQPVITLTVNEEGEQGLLGIALDPGFEENHYIWAYYSTWSDPNDRSSLIVHRLIRFVEDNGVGRDERIAWEIEDAFQENTILNGGDIKFGPDGYLYLSPGSHNNVLTTVDPNLPQGKIHRMTATVPVQPAPDNPNPESTIWAYGFRNTYAFTFHPETGVMYGTENGPDCDDEINRILPGRNYGWRPPPDGRPDGLCEDNVLPADLYPERFEPPLVYFTPPISPTGIMFYTGDVFPEWHNYMFYCAYNLGRMYFLNIGPDGFAVVGGGSVETGYARCAVDINTGPDGLIYFTDINAVYRLVPPGD